MEETEESSYQMPVYKAKWYLPGGTMDRHCREHVQSILHSGLMFRSESLKVEKALLGYPLPSATMLGPYSPIETLGVVLSSGACVALLYKAKPILVGGAILLCFSAPLVLRLRPRPHLSRLLRALSAATRISWRSARLAQASLPQSLRLGIISLGEAFPWWGDAEDWEWEESVQDALSSKDPKRLYYLYLVLQSLFLYRVSVAHVPPAFPPRDLARRVTWLHETLVPRLCASVETALAAMKTADSTARKTPRNLAIPWGTLRSLPNSASNLERCLHAALEKCDGLFVTMKSKENNELLLKELHELKDYLFKSNVSIDEMISELMPKRVEFTPISQANTEVKDVRIVSEETENVIEDQVFYCENQKDDVVEDMTTAIGVDCSMRLSSAVMGELKERLKEREEVMREREEKALIRTCPEIAACPPHFPRQLGDEAVEEKDKNIDLNETKDDSKECFEAGRLSDVKTINLDYEDVYDTSGSEAETGQGDTGLLKDARKFRISRKKRHPPSRSIVPTGTTELDADDRYNGGGGTAMAELLRARFVLSGSSEQEFIGEGEQSE